MSRQPLPSHDPNDRAYVSGVSLHLRDWEWLDDAVQACREAGLYRMSRSRLLRLGLQRLDLDQVIAEEAGNLATVPKGG